MPLRKATPNGLTRNAGSETGRRFASCRGIRQGDSQSTWFAGVSVREWISARRRARLERPEAERGQESRYGGETSGTGLTGGRARSGDCEWEGSVRMQVSRPRVPAHRGLSSRKCRIQNSWGEHVTADARIGARCLVRHAGGCAMVGWAALRRGRLHAPACRYSGRPGQWRLRRPDDEVVLRCASANLGRAVRLRGNTRTRDLGIAELKKLSDRKRLDRQCGLDSVRHLHWTEFEELLAELYRHEGYAVEKTGSTSGDGGVDIRLRRDGQLTLVQCKHWRNRSVGVKVVRELCGVMTSEGAIRGVVVSVGTFTPDATAFAQENRITLIHGNDLVPLIQAVQKRPSRLAVATPTAASPNGASPAGSPASQSAPACSAMRFSDGPADGAARRERGPAVLGLPEISRMPGDAAVIRTSTVSRRGRDLARLAQAVPRGGSAFSWHPVLEPVLLK